MKYRNLVVAVLAVFLISGSAFAQEKEAPANNVETYRLLDLFGEVFERVRSGYVEAPTDQELIESAIAGMLTSLDPHSSYLSAKSFQDMQVQTRGEFGGLGIEVTMDAGLVKVVSPIDGTPAHRAGLKPGDFISHLEGKPILGLTLAEAVEKMRGKVGTDLRLTIRRKGNKAFDVTVTRAVIQIRSVRSRMEGDIGYLRITSFNEQADKGSIKAIAKFKKNAGDKLKGLVLDLRNNPGGLLDQSVKISDLFLDKGEIVSTRSRRPEDTQRFNAHTGDLMNGLPVIVLINGGSASASEIVAGALQDHGRAILLGTKTFGKGSVQTIMPLSGHGAMRLTTARYYTPSGRSIQAVGIEPDIKVEQARIETLAAQQTRREADLKGALKNEEKAAKKEGEKTAEEKAKKKPEDYQLARALDLLRGLSLFNKTAGLKTQKAAATQ
jgi:carboxyl-terminal processing protease